MNFSVMMKMLKSVVLPLNRSNYCHEMFARKFVRYAAIARPATITARRVVTGARLFSVEPLLQISRTYANITGNVDSNEVNHGCFRSTLLLSLSAFLLASILHVHTFEFAWHKNVQLKIHLNKLKMFSLFLKNLPVWLYLCALSGNRFRCRACRFERCIKAGMMRNGEISKFSLHM